MEATDTDFLMEATDALTEATDFLMVAMDVVTTASVRLTPSPRLMLMLRLIPTSDTDTLEATDTDFLMDATDALTEATDFLMVATEDMVAMDVVTTASVRLTPSPRLMLML